MKERLRCGRIITFASIDPRMSRANSSWLEIEMAWHATHFGYDEIDIEPCYHLDGWLDYMTKRQTKTDFASSIDWNNTQPGA